MGSIAYIGRKILNLLILERKIFFDYISPENFFDLPPTTFPGKIVTTW